MTVSIVRNNGHRLLQSHRGVLPTCVTTTLDGDRVFIAQLNSISILSSTSPDIKIIDTQQRITNLHYIDYLDILIVVWDTKVAIWGGQDYTPLKDFNLNIKIQSVYSWSNYSNEDDIATIQDDKSISSLKSMLDDPNTSSDSLSFATIVDNADSFKDLNNQNLITCLAFVSDNEISIFKWVNDKFHDKFTLHVSNISKLLFISSNELYLITNSNFNDLININLETLQISHNDLQQILQASNSTFFNNNYIIDIISPNHDELIFIKPFELIKVSKFNFKLISKYKIKNKDKGFRYVTYFAPYLLFIYDTKLELISPQSFHLIQSISIGTKGHIVDFSLTRESILLLTDCKLIEFERLQYSEILNEFQNNDLFDEAIDLIESLKSNYFIDLNFPTISQNQMKFIKIRKFQLLKAQWLMEEGHFNKSINLFTEFLAPPELVFSCLPNKLKSDISLDEKDDDLESPQEHFQNCLDQQTMDQIYQLINFITDSRRKLLRLLDSKDTNFKWNQYEISLLIYKIENPKFSILSNLKQLDDYLFNCYLLTNPKIINPFLRLKNYCTLELVEKRCLEYQYYDQLIEFYFNRNEQDKSINLLLKLNDDDKLIIYLKKLIIKDVQNVDFILPYMLNLLERDPQSFKIIFQSDSIDYDGIDKGKVLDFLNTNNLNQLRLDYLEFVIFHLNDHLSIYINHLFLLYFEDVESNYEKIKSLYEIGNYNATSVYRQLKSLNQTEGVKRLQVEPLTKLGRYDQVLEILINDLHDVPEAIDFGLKIKELKGESLCKGLIFKILDICLANNDEVAIVEYLLQNPKLDFLDFEEILNKLPNKMSSNFLSSFLILNLKSLNTVSKQMTIKNELLKVKVINLKYEKIQKEKASATISSNSTCPKCGKKFNKTEVLCFYPNTDVLHYGCSKKSLKKKESI